ncbi:hypothetical protein SAG0043_03080 [Streptococcus agalactiae FSL S3-137]|uniref:hypothetical protein n=1 Tax=Streptococcus agalactiae TaxID=1311 RepID=UPI000304ADDF|nr:hypothetical protein [Streptococcus agalactiae]EPW01167.1 hypothetical protein SAG0043_03080 [Streptococcus agalactiae FSL S3-137]
MSQLSLEERLNRLKDKYLSSKNQEFPNVHSSKVKKKKKKLIILEKERCRCRLEREDTKKIDDKIEKLKKELIDVMKEE